MKVVCVCTGNLCRSPMLEYLLRKELANRGLTDYSVSSVGLDTCDDAPASPHAVTAMKEIGIDLSAHRSHQLTREEAEAVDVFIAMTTDHGVKLAFLYGVDPEKILIPGNGIPDPYGGPLSVYRSCRDLLLETLDTVIEDLLAL